MGITPFDIKSKNYLKGLALQAAQTKNHLSDIINVLLEELVRLKIELPAFSLLRRIAQKARQQINENCYQEVYPFLNKEMMNRLEKLLDKEDKMTSGWDNLKQDAKKPTSHHIKEFVDYLRELQAWRHLLPPY